MTTTPLEWVIPTDLIRSDFLARQATHIACRVFMQLEGSARDACDTWISTKKLAKILDIGPSSVRRALAELEAKEFIRRNPDPDPKGWSTTLLWRIHPSLPVAPQDDTPERAKRRVWHTKRLLARGLTQHQIKARLAKKEQKTTGGETPVGAPGIVFPLPSGENSNTDPPSAIRPSGGLVIGNMEKTENPEGDPSSQGSPVPEAPQTGSTPDGKGGLEGRKGSVMPRPTPKAPLHPHSRPSAAQATPRAIPTPQAQAHPATGPPTAAQAALARIHAPQAQVKFTGPCQAPPAPDADSIAWVQAHPMWKGAPESAILERAWDAYWEKWVRTLRSGCPQVLTAKVAELVMQAVGADPRDRSLIVALCARVQAGTLASNTLWRAIEATLDMAPDVRRPAAYLQSVVTQKVQRPDKPRGKKATPRQNTCYSELNSVS